VNTEELGKRRGTLGWISKQVFSTHCQNIFSGSIIALNRRTMAEFTFPVGKLKLNHASALSKPGSVQKTQTGLFRTMESAFCPCDWIKGW
jgi:hypothetical protein